MGEGEKERIWLVGEEEEEEESEREEMKREEVELEARKCEI
jgi:hypothetical protein